MYSGKPVIGLTGSFRPHELFTLQLLSEDFKKNADSNAFLKHILFPARGAIIDRNGKLLVYNQPAYDIMVVMKDLLSCVRRIK